MKVRIRYRNVDEPWCGGRAIYSHSHAENIILNAIRKGQAKFDLYEIVEVPSRLTDADRERLRALESRAMPSQLVLGEVGEITDC